MQSRPAMPHHRISPTLQLFEIPPFRKRHKNTPTENISASHVNVNQSAWNVVEIPAFKNIHPTHHQQAHHQPPSQPSQQPKHSYNNSSPQQHQQPQPSVSLLSPADTPWTTDHFKETIQPKKMHAGLENCLRERVVHRSVDDLPIKARRNMHQLLKVNTKLLLNLQKPLELHTNDLTKTKADDDIQGNAKLIIGTFLLS